MKRSKYYIKSIILFSTLALIGLICIQFYWMKSSVKQQKAQFHETINNSLREIIQRIEKHETLKKAERTGALSQVLGKSNISVDLYNSLSKNLQFQDSIYHELKNSLKSAWNENSSVIESLFNNLLSIDFFANIEDRIPKKDLENIITATLQKNDINADFKYALVNQNNDTIYSNTNDSLQLAHLKSSKYSVRLFENDFFGPDIFLKLLILDENKYLLKSMWLMLVLSGVFLLAIIGAFYSSISIIFKQKKISIIKNDFINNMTHELKTPISTISLACQALSDEDLSNSISKREKYVATIDEENKRLGDLVENVLQSAVIDKKDLELKLELLDLDYIIKKAIKNIQLQLKNKDGVISLNLMATNTLIEADKIHITNVIFNLLDNAIKYSIGKPEISIETQDVINGVVVKIKDNGIGIAKENYVKIFEKLFRVPTGNLHNVKGFGLGLSYVKSIIEKLNGHIKVESNIGVGSTFIIQLIAAKQVKQ